MVTDLSITCNRTPLSHLGYWDQATMTHRFPYGSYELSWRTDYPRGFRHPDLAVGVEVLGKVGLCRIFRGTLTKADFDSNEFVAQGIIRQAESALAFDFAYNATTDPDEAVGRAAFAGVFDVGTLTNFGPPLTTLNNSNGLNSVMALLDAYADQNDTNVMVNPQGLLYPRADPTVPGIMLTPGTGELGQVDEDYWSTLVGTYTPKPGQYARVSASDTTQNVTPRERAVDLSPRGLIDATTAQSIIDAMLGKGLARTGWSNSIAATSGEIVNMSGATVDPWLVAQSMATTGLMMRLAGLRDLRGVTMYTDVVLEETVWDVDNDTIELKPRGLAARDLSSVVESMGGVLA